MEVCKHTTLPFRSLGTHFFDPRSQETKADTVNRGSPNKKTETYTKNQKYQDFGWFSFGQVRCSGLKCPPMIPLVFLLVLFGEKVMKLPLFAAPTTTTNVNIFGGLPIFGGWGQTAKNNPFLGV